jgi:glyoxylase-like metal-dependent hydrolase (beta-lactamase superfamily II)
LSLALEGMFQARLTNQTARVRRISWLNEALRKLDRAVQLAPGLTTFFRGVVLAELPRILGKAEAAVADLEWVLARKEQFPIGLRRGVYRGLARAYQTLGRRKAAQEALSRSGYLSTDGDQPQFLTDAWYTPQDGLHFVPPRLVEPAPGVHVAQGYDFSDLAFVETDAGLVAIDAGSTDEHARAALDDLRRGGVNQPISHVIVTHAHWDHIGGLGTLHDPGVQVIARDNFDDELRVMRDTGARVLGFFGRGEKRHIDVQPTHLVSEAESLTIGGVEFGLYPVHGGETEDGLLIHVPALDLLFVGDVLMPMLGAPFLPEGSIDGLLETLDVIQGLAPGHLIHGHTALTDIYSIDALPGLGLALRELHAHVLQALREGRTLSETLRDNVLPEGLREHPAAVMPYVVMRDNVIQRLYSQRTGYWQSDGEGIEQFSAEEWAAAVDLLGGGKEGAFRKSVGILLDQGDPGLALKLADLGLVRHADSGALRDLRRRALDRLRERYQTMNPFKLIVYSGLADAELLPVQ